MALAVPQKCLYEFLAGRKRSEREKERRAGMA